MRRHLALVGSATAAVMFASVPAASPAALHGTQANRDAIDCEVDSPLAEPANYAELCLDAPSSAGLGALSSASLAGLLAPTDFAFALDFTSDNFVRHRLNDFPGQTVLGPNTMSIFGMDFDPKATQLYALDNNGQQLGTMTLTNGAFTAIGPSIPLAGHTWTGLTIDPRTGTFYASSVDGTTFALYTLDPATGTAALVDTQTTTPLAIDISMNCSGAIYAHDIGTDSIYRIDPTSAAAALIGPTGVNSNFAQGMDFDNDTGTLYAYTFQGGGANQYGTIDLSTGALTPLAIDDPQGEFEGATQTKCPPPDTKITKKPKKKTTKRRAVFRFRSPVAIATFECKLDRKPYRPCSSPFRKRVTVGRHRFLVRAMDASGKDPTPARYRWRVLAPS